MTNLLLATITAYCHCAPCCGKAGQPTASGRMPQAGRTIAAPRSVPFGTRVEIEGRVYIVEDRTAIRYDGRWDVFMSTHRKAKEFGKKKIIVKIKEIK
jgi:3D (Asp-Asp-Asp) domain-containing protein